MKTLPIITVTAGLILSTGCAFKKEEDVSPVVYDLIGSSDLKPAPILDQDKDGFSDSLESEIGRDKLIGEFASFSIGTFNYTSLEVKDLTPDNNDLSIMYVLDKETGRNLDYNPIRDKMAKASYQRIIGQPINPEPINAYDFGVVKLSSFSHVDYMRVKNYLFKHRDDLESKAVRIQSRFFLSANNFLGIKRIFNIQYEVGYVSENGGFVSFGGNEPLKGIDGTRVSFNSRGDNSEARVNTECLIFIDRLPLDTLNTILDNKYDLALKIVDYKAQLVNGRTFTYSTQLAEATSAGSLFAISTPSQNKLFFNARNEPISETLKSFFEGELETDGEGTLLSLGSLERTTSQPVTFEEEGNEHLKGKDWYIFSENDRVSDIPKLNDSVMIGFFQNSFLAQSAGRLIQVSTKKYEAEEITRDIINLNLGETISLEISGSNTIHSSSSERQIHVWVEGTQHHPTCINIPCPGGGDIFSVGGSGVGGSGGGGAIGGSGGGGPAIEKNRIVSKTFSNSLNILSENILLTSSTNAGDGGPRRPQVFEDGDRNKCGQQCDYRYSKLGCHILWKDLITNTSALNLYSGNKLSQIRFSTQLNPNPIPLSDASFFKKNLPVQDLEKGSGFWVFRFTVDEDFLKKHGETIRILLPAIRNPAVRYGLHQDLNCASQVRNHRYLDGNINRKQIDGDVQKSVTFKIRRSF